MDPSTTLRMTVVRNAHEKHGHPTATALSIPADSFTTPVILSVVEGSIGNSGINEKLTQKHVPTTNRAHKKQQRHSQEVPLLF